MPHTHHPPITRGESSSNRSDWLTLHQATCPYMPGTLFYSAAQLRAWLCACFTAWLRSF